MDRGQGFEDWTDAPAWVPGLPTLHLGMLRPLGIGQMVYAWEYAMEDRERIDWILYSVGS